MFTNADFMQQSTAYSDQPLFSARSHKGMPSCEFRFTKEIGPFEVSSSTVRRQDIINLIQEIEKYKNMPAGWDNESNEVTDEHCLVLSEKFIRRLKNHHTLPKFSAATGEEVSLYWRKPSFYFIINFFKNDTISYLYKKNKMLMRGDYINFSGESIDEIVISILDDISRSSYDGAS